MLSAVILVSLFSFFFIFASCQSVYPSEWAYTSSSSSSSASASSSSSSFSPSCSSNYYFSVSSLQCEACDVSDASNSEIQSSSSIGGLYTCKCQQGFYDANNYVYQPQTMPKQVNCVACPKNTVSTWYSDLSCMPCDSTPRFGSDSTLPSSFISSSMECACPNPNTQVIVERDAAGQQLAAGKRCIECTGNYYKADAYTCKHCQPNANATLINGNWVCVCNAGYTLDGAQCVSNSNFNAFGNSGYSDNTAGAITYSTIRNSETGDAYSVTVSDSLLIHSLFRNNAFSCYFSLNVLACSALANACVLSFYSLPSSTSSSPTSGSSTSCTLLYALIDSVTLVTHSMSSFGPGTGWKVHMPLVKYGMGAYVLTDQSQIVQQVQLKGDNSADLSTVSTLSFLLAVYDVNGTLMTMTPLSNQLQLCPTNPQHVTNYLHVGSDYMVQCNVDWTQYIATTTVNLYALFLLDAKSMLYPVPVKVLNIGQNRRQDGSENSDPGSVTLTHRFYLYDAVTSVSAQSSSSSSSSSSTTTTLPLISFAKTIELRLTIIPNSDNKMYTPLLVLTYEQRPFFYVSSSLTSVVTFQVTYTKDLSTFWQASTGLFSCAIVIAFLLALRELVNYSRQNQGATIEIDLIIMGRMLLWMFTQLGKCFFVMMTVLSWYCFLFFKGQQTIFFLLPPVTSYEVSVFKIFVIYCFTSQLCLVVWRVYDQSRQDLFLIDWEKPRGQSSINSEDSERVTVSVWRKLFAANELNELATARVVNVPLSLFIMISLLSALSLESLATAQPSSSNLDPTIAPSHPILLFAVVTFFLLLITFLQLLFGRLVYNRYIEDVAASFVDLCATSNISCLLFTGRLHAYYIHGKSVHAHADTSLEEMNLQLAHEQKHHTKERGLVEGKDTVECYLTPDFRQHYDNEYGDVLARQMLQKQRARRRESATKGGGGGGGVGGADVESQSRDTDLTALMADRLLKANASLNVFLCSFFDSHLGAHPWDLRPIDGLRKLLKLPPKQQPHATDDVQHGAGGGGESERAKIRMRTSSATTTTTTVGRPNVFIDDPDFGFTCCFLMGMEWDLAILLVLVYALIDINYNNTIAAALLSYALDRIIVWYRGHFGKMNLAKKTLIDDRFLV